MKRVWLVLALLAFSTSAACAAKFVPPQPAAVKTPSGVMASYDKTWEAVITYFADRNIPIRTLEKVSGIIVAEPAAANLVNRVPVLDKNGKVLWDRRTRKPVQSPPIYADCGSRNGYGDDPNSAIYNIRVLGDASASSVQVNVQYLYSYQTARLGPASTGCTSTGKWEDETQAFIKQRAETSPRP